MPLKQTKIVATIGPASEKTDIIKELIIGGATIFRFNLKHNTWQWHNLAIKTVRETAKNLGISVGIMVDVPRSDYNIGEIVDFDILALSYLKTAMEIDHLRELYTKKGLKPIIIAKIENKRALENLDKIISAADGVMVARGDLGEAISFKELAYYQKIIINQCRKQLKPVIVATEMLLSMVTNKTPTRTEATDVANAVYDGTDAVMLSQETAMGNHPGICVKTMAEIVSFADKTVATNNIIPELKALNDELFITAAEIVNKSKGQIKGVVVTTKSGRSGFKMASFRVRVPVIAVSDSQKVLNGLNLGYGVVPVKDKQYQPEKLFKKGDSILLIHGQNWLEAGSTNTISIVTV
ncbi:MAG: pyruvate kinase [Candidatus Shapirobacteria bacterium]|nr:pyruvate kinase [Candidatus Shapirobacteria bacterium]